MHRYVAVAALGLAACGASEGIESLNLAFDSEVEAQTETMGTGSLARSPKEPDRTVIARGTCILTGAGTANQLLTLTLALGTDKGSDTLTYVLPPTASITVPFRLAATWSDVVASKQAIDVVISGSVSTGSARCTGTVTSQPLTNYQ
ncbi:MAG: hypothetical protein IT381_20040 [Deltaproteobacteria bacterium]|nr:hypothetical protein [Deltaproteobacteria bacterium]